MCLTFSVYIICGSGGDLAIVPTDKDLQVSFLDLEKKENGYTYFFKAGNNYTKDTRVEDFLADNENYFKNHQQVVQFLQKTKIWKHNQKILRLIKSGLACKQAQVFPEHAHQGFPLDFLSNLRNFTAVMEIKCFDFAHKGKYQQALKLANQITYTGRMIQQAAISDIFYLYGSSIKRAGLSTVCKLISQFDVNNMVLRKYLKDMEQLHNNQKVFAVTAVKGNYQFIKNNFDTIAQELSSPITRIFFYKHNATLTVFIRMYRDICKGIMKTANYQKSYDNFNTKYKDYKWENMSLFSLIQNGIGKGIIRSYNPNILLSIYYDDRTFLEAASVVIAQKAYQNDHEHTADLLEQLVPQYLPKIPNDYFTGKPLKYDSDKKVIHWSHPNLDRSMKLDFK